MYGKRHGPLKCKICFVWTQWIVIIKTNTKEQRMTVLWRILKYLLLTFSSAPLTFTVPRILPLSRFYLLNHTLYAHTMEKHQMLLWGFFTECGCLLQIGDELGRNDWDRNDRMKHYSPSIIQNFCQQKCKKCVMNWIEPDCLVETRLQGQGYTVL